jgi:calcineurin-like phosphoesterase family protein
MPAVYLTADPHFGHEGVCRFMRNDGVTKLRPWDNAAEMNEAMIKNWNETVRPNDKVYVLGDVAMNKNALHAVMPRLNGDKVLIKGNHDIMKLDDYVPRRKTGHTEQEQSDFNIEYENKKNVYFRDIRAYHVMNGLILSHIPIHAASLARFGCNVHGHLHANEVRKPRGVDAKTGTVLYSNEPDPNYFCASVEHTDFTPILFEDAMKRIIARGGTVGFKSGNFERDM